MYRFRLPPMGAPLERRGRRGLLVLAVLAGLLAMHGLAPGVTPVPAPVLAPVPMSAHGDGVTMDHTPAVAHTPGVAHSTGAAHTPAVAHSTAVAHTPGAAHSTGVAHSAHIPAAAHARVGCRHIGGHGAGGHGAMHHADGTCAADGVSSAYAPPVPARNLVDAAGDTVLSARPPVPEAAGRPPPAPDLSRLQLLRI